MRLRGGATIKDINDFQWFSGHVDHGVSRLSTVMPSGITLLVDNRRETQATFEFSVPRFIYDTNLVTVGVDQATEVVRHVYDEASHYVNWAVSLEDLGITRLDTTRHFIVGGKTPDVLDGLRLTSPRRSLRTRVHTMEDGDNSIQRGTPKRWLGKLYDKGEERRVAAARSRSGDVSETRRRQVETTLASGVLRFEATMRRPVLREHGIGVVRDLEDSRTATLTHHFFQQAGFDQEVGGMSKIKAIALIASSEGNYSDFTKALLDAQLEALGLPPAVEAKTRKRYLRTRRRYGISPADFLLPERESIRLDFGSGKLIDGRTG